MAMTVHRAGPDEVFSGQQDVTDEAATISGGDNLVSQELTIKADLGNTITVYIGPSGVTTSTGFALTPGQVVTVSAASPSQVYVIASDDGASVSWFAS